MIIVFNSRWFLKDKRCRHWEVAVEMGVEMCVVVLEWMKYSNDEKGAVWDETKSNTIYRLENEMIRVVQQNPCNTNHTNMIKKMMLLLYYYTRIIRIKMMLYYYTRINDNRMICSQHERTKIIS